MKKEQTKKGGVLFVAAVFVVTLMFGLMVERILYFDQQERSHDAKTAVELSSGLVESSVTHYQELTQLIMETILRKPTFLAILNEAGNADETLKATLREELLVRVMPLYKKVKHLGIRQLHFHLPDGESFLRMHRPDRFGDFLFSIRTSVYLANSEKHVISGFEEGRVFSGYRFVYPLSYEGRHIGSVELGVGYDMIRRELERIKTYHSYFIFDKEIMQKALFNDETAQLHTSFVSELFVHEKNDYYDPYGDFEGDEHEHNPMLSLGTMQQINSLLKGKIDEQLRLKEQFYEDVFVEGHRWMVLFTPIRNLTEKTVGFIVTYIPAKKMNAAKNRYGVMLFGLALAYILIILLIGLTHRARRKAEHEVAKNASLLSQVLRSEEELRELNDTLEVRIKEEIDRSRQKDQVMIQQSRLAAMGEMIGNIAHQWRQPLNAVGLIFSKFEIANEADRLDEKMLLEGVRKGEILVQQMSQTIDDFRNFFRPDKAKKVFDVRTSVQSVIVLVESMLQAEKIAFINCVADEPLEIEGYPGEFSQVLLNLITNARDAIKDNDIKKGKIDLEAEREEDWVIVMIRDNGGGIPEDILPKIFEPYFTTKEQGHGTGVGLYMSRQIIENSMMGEIIVENRDQGACFMIRLPAASQKEQG